MAPPRHLNHVTIEERVMHLIRENPGLSGTILAQRTGIQYDTMLGILPRLRREGRIIRQRVTDPGHFRCGEMGYFLAPARPLSEFPCPS